MKKICLFLSIIFLSSASFADDIDFIHRAEKSLNSFKTANGMFRQYDSLGDISTGEFWISKPNKIRFNYAHPNKNYIVSDGHFIYFWDEGLQQQTNAPLSYTPASLILAEEIKFKDDVLVKNVHEEDEYYMVEVCSKENEDMGSLSLIFDKVSNELSRWVVNEANGSTTNIYLMDVEFDAEKDIDSNLFKFKDPRRNPFKLN